MRKKSNYYCHGFESANHITSNYRRPRAIAEPSVRQRVSEPLPLDDELDKTYERFVVAILSACGQFRADQEWLYEKGDRGT